MLVLSKQLHGIFPVNRLDDSISELFQHGLGYSSYSIIVFNKEDSFCARGWHDKIRMRFIRCWRLYQRKIYLKRRSLTGFAIEIYRAFMFMDDPVDNG